MEVKDPALAAQERDSDVVRTSVVVMVSVSKKTITSVSVRRISSHLTLLVPGPPEKDKGSEAIALAALEVVKAHPHSGWV